MNAEQKTVDAVDTAIDTAAVFGLVYNAGYRKGVIDAFKKSRVVTLTTLGAIAVSKLAIRYVIRRLKKNSVNIKQLIKVKVDPMLGLFFYIRENYKRYYEKLI